MENIPKDIECATFPKKVFGPRNFFFFFNKGTRSKECSLRNCIMLRQSEHELEKNFKLGTFQKGVSLLSARHCECSGSTPDRLLRANQFPELLANFYSFKTKLLLKGWH